jgi:hypothetical protein
MRKRIVSALLFPILLTITMSAGSQTRPRRVEQATITSSELTPEVREQERPRLTNSRLPETTSEERRETAPRARRWPRILLGAGIVLGSGVLLPTCGPSRGTILQRPRFMPQISAR